MAVIDKVMRRRQTATNLGGDHQSRDQSGTQTEADLPVIRRLRIVVTQLADYARTEGSESYSRHAWVAVALFENLLDEMPQGINDEIAREWFLVFAQIITWCSTGDVSVLPPQVRRFLATHHPEELPAIEAASA